MRTSLNLTPLFGGALYHHPYVTDMDDVLWNHLLSLQWVTQKAARHEYFMSTTPRTYSYGNKGVGSQEYHSQPFTDKMEQLLEVLNVELDTEFNVCFLNKYDNQHQHLGWHADDFPGMRHDQPIAVISMGAERELWLKDKRGIEVSCPQCGGYGFSSSERQAREDERGAACDLCGGKGQIWSMGVLPKDQRVLLQNGSLFIMPEGYQDKYLHRIPKHDRPCGPRISLTFRSFV